MEHNVTATIGTYNRSGGSAGSYRGGGFSEEAVDSGGVVVSAEKSKGLLFLAKAIHPRSGRDSTTSFVRDIAN